LSHGLRHVAAGRAVSNASPSHSLPQVVALSALPHPGLPALTAAAELFQRVLR